MKKYFYLLTILILFSCSEEKIKPKIENGLLQGEIPSHESWNSKVIFSKEGKLKAILYADHLKKYEIQQITLIENLKVDFYDNNQKKVTTLTAKFGKVDDQTLNMFAKDSVIAINDAGTILKTSELMWINKDQKILSDKFVSIKSKDEIIEGYGFESDQNLSNYIIYKITYSAILKNEEKIEN